MRRRPELPTATPGDFACGDTLVRVDDPSGYTFFAGPTLADTSDAEAVQIIRTCYCGGWFRATRTAFVRAPESRTVPVPPGLCG